MKNIQDSHFNLIKRYQSLLSKLTQINYRLLDNYRKKCENDGLYSEAKKSTLKINEIKEKEILR